MVKGVTKRVVVVRCPETGYFDEAIFMVREDAVGDMTPAEVLKEVTAVADRSVREMWRRGKSPGTMWPEGWVHWDWWPWGSSF